MALLRLPLSGSGHRYHSDATAGVVEKIGILGVDISARTVGESNYTVVQVLLDDERPDGDLSLLSCPLVAEVIRADGDQSEPEVVAGALFDHDEFRRKLKLEQDSGESTTTGVLVLTDGELPPPWTRLAFVPIPLRLTAGLNLRISRTDVQELTDGVEQAFAAGRINETERRSLLISIEQHHPPAEPA